MTERWHRPWWELMEEAQGSKTEVECWIAEPRIPEVRRQAHYKGTSQTLAFVVYKEMVGVVLPGHMVRTNCGNKHCVNPRHLYLEDDSLITMPPGKNGPRLIPEEVKAIRKELAKGTHRVWIARKFGVTPETIRRIDRKIVWANIPD